MRGAVKTGPARMKIIVATFLVFGALGVEAAAADNFFIRFLRGDWLRPPPAPVALPAPSAPSTRGLSITVTPRGGSLVYCVRTCDGRYFPLSGVSVAGGSAAERCSQMCPAAQTRIFTSGDRGAGIEAAYATDGEPYSAMPNAFLYRTELRADCRCNAASAMGVEPIDIKDDPTLKPGDLVVTGDGIMVFRGRGSVPHAEADFTPARVDRKLPNATRRQVQAIEIASGLSSVGTSR